MRKQIIIIISFVVLIFVGILVYMNFNRGVVPEGDEIDIRMLECATE